MKNEILLMATGSNTVAEHSSHLPKVQGSSPFNVAGIVERKQQNLRYLPK